MERERNLAICLRCGYKWYTVLNTDEMVQGRQCHKCHGKTAHLLRDYKRDLKHLREQFSKEDLQKFLELYNYAVEHGYIREKRMETKFSRLLKDLVNPESSLGADL